MSKLLSQGGYGCVYYPGIACDGRVNKSKKYVTKLQKADISFRSELNIGRIIRNIDYYHKFFAPIKEYCDVNLSEIDSNDLHKCDIVKKSQKQTVNYGLMQLDYINGGEFKQYVKWHMMPSVSQEDGVDKEGEEVTLWGVNDTVVFLLETYSHLLEAVKLIYENGIIHYDLKSVNVLWNSQVRKPIVIDFGLSINTRTQLTYELRKEPFYVYSPSYTLWTPEIHLLCYVIHERKTKTETDILLEVELSGIIEKIADNGVFMDIINTYFDGDYATVLLNFWRDAYMDFTERELFDRITRARTTETWDNYALSIMYLRFIVEYGSEQVKTDPVIQEFVAILMKNIHPDPSQRYTIGETREKWGRIVGYQ